MTYKSITGITNAAPVVITVPSHGIPDGWRVSLSSVGGMTQINAKNNPPKASDDPYKSDYKTATLVSANAISLNLVNSSEFDAFSSGGYVQFGTPIDLAGYTARLTIKDKVGGTVLLSLTTENGGIVIDNGAKTITLTIAATATDDFVWTKGVFDMEMVSSTGVVSELLAGTVTVVKEVTT